MFKRKRKEISKPYKKVNEAKPQRERFKLPYLRKQEITKEDLDLAKEVLKNNDTQEYFLETKIDSKDSFTDTEKVILNITTAEEKEVEKNNLISVTVKDEMDNEAGIQDENQSDEVEKAVAVAIRGLTEPENTRHFSDLSKRQAYFMSLGYEYCKSIDFPEPTKIFDDILDLVISSGRKGRTELKEVGVAGVNREKQSIWDKMQFWKQKP